jgi:hypothetical protein
MVKSTTETKLNQNTIEEKWQMKEKKEEPFSHLLLNQNTVFGKKCLVSKEASSTKLEAESGTECKHKMTDDRNNNPSTKTARTGSSTGTAATAGLAASNSAFTPRGEPRAEPRADKLMWCGPLDEAAAAAGASSGSSSPISLATSRR